MLDVVLTAVAALVAVMFTFGWVNMHRRARYRQFFLGDIEAMTELVSRTLDATHPEDLVPFRTHAAQRGWPAVYAAIHQSSTGSAGVLYLLLLVALVLTLVVVTVLFGPLAGLLVASVSLLVAVLRWKGTDTPTRRSVHHELALETLPLAAWRLAAPEEFLSSEAGQTLLGQVVGLVALEARYWHLAQASRG